MSFESFSDFLAMGGHGIYVWLCYGVGGIVLIGNLIGARQARSRLLKDLMQKQRRDEQLQKQMAATSSGSESIAE